MNRLLRKTLRSIGRNPTYSAAVIVTLALGIGVSTSAFTVLDRLVFRDPDRVFAPDGLRRVFVTYLASQFNPVNAERHSFSYPEVVAIRDAVAGEAQVTAYENWPTSLAVRIGDAPLRARVLGVATNYFAVLGVGPAAGRFFAAPSPLAAPEGPPLEAVISERYWRRVLGGRPDVIGMKVAAWHQTMTIVGIAPPRFGGLNLDAPDIYIPWEVPNSARFGPTWTTDWQQTVNSVALRYNGAAIDPAWTGRIRRSLTEAAGGVPGRPRIGPVQLATLPESLAPDFEQEIRIGTAFWAISLLVLLVAAINAGSLLLVRAFEERRLTAVALAIGAGRWRVVGDRIAEGLVLAAGGAVLGAVFARFGSELIRTGIADFIHYEDGLVSWRAFGYSAAVAGVVGVAASALPALRASRVDLRILLDEGVGTDSPGMQRMGAVLNGLQVALAVVVLYAAALAVRSARAANATPLGADIHGLVVASAELGPEGYDNDAIKRFWEGVAAEMRASPGVAETGLSSTLMFRAEGRTALVLDGTTVDASLAAVDPGYLTALKIKVSAGRGFTTSDGPTADRVALVSRLGAVRLFGSASPLGRCIRQRGRPERCLRVVGVVEDTRRLALVEQQSVQVYLPWSQDDIPFGFVVARAKPGAEALVRDRLTSLIAKRVPASTQFTVAPMRDDFDQQTGRWVKAGRVLTVFGLLAALVTFAGIFGTVTYDQLRRRRELGIRLALGARAGQLVATAMGRALRWCMTGALLGVVVAVIGALGVRAMLFGTAPWDTPSLIVTPMVALVLVSGAALLGARRAAVRDPSFLLRIGR